MLPKTHNNEMLDFMSGNKFETGNVFSVFGMRYTKHLHTRFCCLYLFFYHNWA